MELKGRRALVTGAGVRVGRAMARELLSHGVHVAIHYHDSERGAKELAAEAKALGLEAPLLQADLADAQQAMDLASRAAELLGGLEILVNSAAIMERRRLEDVTPADWDRTMDLNLRGAFFVAQGAASAIRRSGGSGAIVNIADLAAFERWAGYPVHAISKAGVVALTGMMAKALAPGIRVNAVAPGAVLLPDDWSEEARARLAATTPLGRLGSPADVVSAVIFLLEQEYVTGQTLVVDGGRLIR